MKKALLALAVAGAAVSAQADTKLYGHVAYNIVDLDGANDIAYQGHAFSQSRFGFKFSKKLGNGLTAVALQELGLPNSGESTLNSRRHAFGFKGDFGQVLLGQYNDVGDGVLNADLAGTGLVNPLGSNSASAVGIGVNGFDPGRGDGLRYYSPKLGGIATIGLQSTDNGGSEVALKLNANGFRLYAFSADNGAGSNDTEGFLVGYKAPIGLSVTYTASEQDGTNIEHDGFKIGYATGKHKVSYSQTERETAGVAGNESTGLSYLYNMAKGVQLWVGYKEVETAAGVQVNEGIAVGGRVKF